MIRSSPTIDKRIINIRLHITVELILKDFIHQSLIGDLYIFQAKGHHPITVNSLFSDKGYFFLIFRCHSDLIITDESAHEAEELMSGDGIHQLINSGQRVAILGTSFVEIDEVDAHAPLPVCLLDQHNIG